jgi:hypothetical protein
VCLRRNRSGSKVILVGYFWEKWWRPKWWRHSFVKLFGVTKHHAPSIYRVAVLLNVSKLVHWPIAGLSLKDETIEGLALAPKIDAQTDELIIPTGEGEFRVQFHQAHWKSRSLPESDKLFASVKATIR